VPRLAAYETKKTRRKRTNAMPDLPRKENVQRLLNRKLAVTPTVYPMKLEAVSLIAAISFAHQITPIPIHVFASPTIRNLTSGAGIMGRLMSFSRDSTKSNCRARHPVGQVDYDSRLLLVRVKGSNQTGARKSTVHRELDVGVGY
jgi:hypothetical protein